MHARGGSQCLDGGCLQRQPCDRHVHDAGEPFIADQRVDPIEASLPQVLTQNLIARGTRWPRTNGFEVAFGEHPDGPSPGLLPCAALTLRFDVEGKDQKERVPPAQRSGHRPMPSKL